MTRPPPHVGIPLGGLAGAALFFACYAASYLVGAEGAMILGCLVVAGTGAAAILYDDGGDWI